MATDFHEELKKSVDKMVHEVYGLSKQFPRDEIHGAISQLRRAALSVALNYVEGFARGRRAVNRNFVETAYGSLQETKYILKFATEEGWLRPPEAQPVIDNVEKIGGMLWGVIKRLKTSPS